ncbi:hypothetical protein SLS62_009961 [Diatrype stigma]|uniref:Uncharacterized protein n=1 Tax=Diatrype stigma TaxID=117547 RepID=A0AAN9YJH4_9PEZI
MAESNTPETKVPKRERVPYESAWNPATTELDLLVAIRDHGKLAASTQGSFGKVTLWRQVTEAMKAKNHDFSEDAMQQKWSRDVRPRVIVHMDTLRLKREEYADSKKILEKVVIEERARLAELAAKAEAAKAKRARIAVDAAATVPPRAVASPSPMPIRTKRRAESESLFVDEDQPATIRQAPSRRAPSRRAPNRAVAGPSTATTATSPVIASSASPGLVTPNAQSDTVMEMSYRMQAMNSQELSDFLASVVAGARHALHEKRKDDNVDAILRDILRGPPVRD